MRLYHDSRNIAYRAPFGARACLEEVCLRCDAPGAEEVILRLWVDDHEERHRMAELGNGKFEAAIRLPEKPGLVWYYFIARRGNIERYLGNAWDNLGGEGCEYQNEPPSFQITVYDPAFETPEWLRNGLMYQIFPDRFCRSGSMDGWDREPAAFYAPETGSEEPDYFYGDLDGIAKKLSHLKKLGVTILYLNPIFQAASVHRYDTSDYENVDERLGGNEAFDRLQSACRQNGIRLILDGVFSHTGADSRYFNKYGRYDSIGACQSMNSPYSSWYRFDHWPEEYECWWGFKHLPNTNENDPNYREYIREIIRKWLDAGASGWRLDVADELPMDFLRMLRKTAGDAPLIGEVWEDASRKVAYNELRCYCLGDTVDSVMNYPCWEMLTGFLMGKIGASQAARQMEALREAYPPAFFHALMNMTGSHDRPRILEMLSGEWKENSPKEQRRATTLSAEGRARGGKLLLAMYNFLCSMPGVPSVYYGDEVGLAGVDDPFNRRPFPWNCMDEALMDGFVRAGQRRMSDEIWTMGESLFEADGDNRLKVTRVLGERTVCAVLDRAQMECAITECFT